MIHDTHLFHRGEAYTHCDDSASNRFITCTSCYRQNPHSSIRNGVMRLR
jgi:hypothetical protein